MGQIDTGMGPRVSGKGLRAGRKEEKEEQRPPASTSGILKGC